MFRLELARHIFIQCYESNSRDFQQKVSRLGKWTENSSRKPGTHIIYPMLRFGF